MNLRSIISEISKREEIKQQPPILIDIGASGQINSIWKTLAPFSICLAFDADDREFGYFEEKNSIFKNGNCIENCFFKSRIVVMRKSFSSISFCLIRKYFMYFIY